MRIFQIHQARDIGIPRPQFNYHDPRTKKWKDLDEFETLTRDLPLYDLPDIQLWTEDGTGSEWDFLAGDGYVGLISERLCLEFARHAGCCFQYFPVNVDERLYFIPIRWKAIDCLDIDRSIIDYNDSTNPHRITWVRKYAFVDGALRDPQAFCLPQLERSYVLFVTDGVKRAIEDLGVFGVQFDLVDTVG